MSDTKYISIEVINKEIHAQLSNAEVSKALLVTTFTGLDLPKMAMALREGMVSGFKFEDFLKKDVYAVPFSGGKGYSLVTSIDYSRKIAMRSGLVGKEAPVYTYIEIGGKKQIESCSVTVKRLVEGHIGEYTSTVFFNEYSTGKNLWASKPHTMIAKVAEMHALRMAFPEEMAKQYVEEEMREVSYVEVPNGITDDQRNEAVLALEEASDKEALGNVWISLSAKAREDSTVKATMARLKAKFDEPEPPTEEATTPIKKRTPKAKVETPDDGSVPQDQLPEDLK